MCNYNKLGSSVTRHDMEEYVNVSGKLDLSKMNDSQRQAVTHGEGPLLLLAGPGSGKTFTIINRIF